MTMIQIELALTPWNAYYIICLKIFSGFFKPMADHELRICPWISSKGSPLKSSARTFDKFLRIRYKNFHIFDNVHSRAILYKFL